MILHAIAKVHDWRNQSHTVDILTASQNSAKTKKRGVILKHNCSSSLKDPDMTVDAQPPPWQQIVDKKVFHITGPVVQRVEGSPIQQRRPEGCCLKWQNCAWI